MMQVFENIRNWAEDRNLIQGSTAKSQMIKLMEEIGELASAMAKNNEVEVYDSIGDAIVVLTVIAKQYGVNVEYCVECAYDTIKDRKGKMVNGIFIKESA
jgi:NTP pyrophosphatase (non-canonical NTP hydrolase)